MSKRRWIVLALVFLFAFSVAAAAVLPPETISTQFPASFRLVINPSMDEPTCPTPGSGGCGG